MPEKLFAELTSPAKLPELVGTAAGVYLMLNGHQIIGAALTAWFGYQVIYGKPLVTVQLGSFSV